MNYLNVKEIRLFDADSLEYAGCIKVNGQSWHMME